MSLLTVAVDKYCNKLEELSKQTHTNLCFSSLPKEMF